MERTWQGSGLVKVSPRMAAHCKTQHHRTCSSYLMRLQAELSLTAQQIPVHHQFQILHDMGISTPQEKVLQIESFHLSLYLELSTV